MRFAWLLILMWQAGAADLLDQTRERGALLEADRQWEQAGFLLAALGNLGADALLQDRFWLLTSLVEVSFEQQDYGQARRWLQEAEKAVGDLNPSVPERVRLLSAWGTLHLVEGNLTAAERDLSRAVAASESVAKPPDLAAALHNLAAVEMHMGRLDPAAVHEKKALALLAAAVRRSQSLRNESLDQPLFAGGTEWRLAGGRKQLAESLGHNRDARGSGELRGRTGKTQTASRG